MNIKQRRLQYLVENVLKEELQRGNLPSSREFIGRIRDHLQAGKLDKPSLEHKTIRRGATAYAEDVNTAINQAYEDLGILYESMTGKYDTALKNFNKFDIDKSKLDYELNKLENHLKELILLYGQSGFLTSVYDVFDDLLKVDTEKTTAEVNIKSHEVTLLQSANLSHKLSTSNAVSSFVLSDETRNAISSRKTLGNTAHGLSDNIDEVWAEVLYATTSNAAVEGWYEVDFRNETFPNNIEIDLHTGTPVNLTLEYSPDGTAWRTLPIFESKAAVEGVLTYNFNHVRMRKFRVKMKKTESDHSSALRNGDKQSIVYGYLLGIKKLSFFQTGYASEGEFYSKKLIPITKEEKPFTVSKVSLDVDEIVPNGTTMDYFIAMVPEAGNEPEWKAISPVNRQAPNHDQIIDFKNITTSPAITYSIDPKISIGEFRLESLYANGIDFYRLGDVEGRRLIEGTEQLFVGRDSWSVKSYEYTHPVGHIPSLKDWEKPTSQVKEDFKKIANGKTTSLLSEDILAPTSYMFTLGIFSRKEETTVSTVPVSSDPIAIYVNGLKVFEGIPTPSTRVNYLFKSGWNEINILTYVIHTVGQQGSSILSIGFDPREQGAYTYSKARSMEKVSLFDLRYNTKSNDRTKYAILETNGRYTIVLNHIISDLDYDFYSDYIDGEPKTEILFKAVMKLDRAVSERSPKLKTYRLRFN